MRLASFNSRVQLTLNSPTIHSLTRYAQDNHIDVIFLQEVGRAHAAFFDNPDKLNGYRLYLSCNTLYESVGFLVSSVYTKFIDENKIRHHIRCRLMQITIDLKNRQYNFCTYYFPSRLESTPVTHRDACLALRMTDILLNLLRKTPNLIVGGDFNEGLCNSDRACGTLGSYGSRFLVGVVL